MVCGCGCSTSQPRFISCPGTFGRVLECWDRKHKEYVAIKIVRNIDKYRHAAMIEVSLTACLHGIHEIVEYRRRDQSIILPSWGSVPVSSSVLHSVSKGFDSAQPGIFNTSVVLVKDCIESIKQHILRRLLEG